MQPRHAGPVVACTRAPAWARCGRLDRGASGRVRACAALALCRRRRLPLGRPLHAAALQYGADRAAGVRRVRTTAGGVSLHRPRVCAVVYTRSRGTCRDDRDCNWNSTCAPTVCRLSPPPIVSSCEQSRAAPGACRCLDHVCAAVTPVRVRSRTGLVPVPHDCEVFSPNGPVPPGNPDAYHSALAMLDVHLPDGATLPARYDVLALEIYAGAELLSTVREWTVLMAEPLDPRRWAEHYYPTRGTDLRAMPAPPVIVLSAVHSRVWLGGYLNRPPRGEGLRYRLRLRAGSGGTEVEIDGDVNAGWSAG
jgi:hypothetical protein